MSHILAHSITRYLYLYSRLFHTDRDLFRLTFRTYSMNLYFMYMYYIPHTCSTEATVFIMFILLLQIATCTCISILDYSTPSRTFLSHMYLFYMYDISSHSTVFIIFIFIPECSTTGLDLSGVYFVRYIRNYMI